MKSKSSDDDSLMFRKTHMAKVLNAASTQLHEGGESPNPLSKFSAEQLKKLSGSELSRLWHFYASDPSDDLSNSDLKRLAAHCIDRILTLFADNIRQQQPRIRPHTLAALVEKEKYYLLPGKKKGDKEAVHNMAKHILSRIDVNKDGSISKTEFVMRWPALAEELFVLRQDGAMGCAIL